MLNEMRSDPSNQQGLFEGRYKKNAPPLGSHFLQANIIIFELIQDIIATNLLTKFHEDWTINVASRGNKLTRDTPPTAHKEKPGHYTHQDKNAPPLVAMFLNQPKPFSELIQDINGTNLLTKFHDDRKINVTSRVLTRKIAPPPWWPYIIGMNLLTQFQEDRTIIVASRVKNAPPLGGHVFQANVTIFKLIQDIIETNLLTIFHQDWTITVASRVLTRKNASPPGGHVFQPTGIIFELVKDINGMNRLTKFYEDQTINVASRVFTRQMLTPHNGRRKKKRSQKLTMSTLCSEKTRVLGGEKTRGRNVQGGKKTSGRKDRTLYMRKETHLYTGRLSSDNHLVDGRTDRPT
ncbi:hypothetical protein DPMN_105339 [Dreissena polymorpha]|uniref:Uncharacterized protein n=1 Tax=Dreissena polymorpha TaxID=45954 RepID=A0A9D4HDM5_DREPO|nr:hypothetical protein DPMN_105339 [Dreissena polymorpha]